MWHWKEECQSVSQWECWLDCSISCTSDSRLVRLSVCHRRDRTLLETEPELSPSTENEWIYEQWARALATRPHVASPPVSRSIIAIIRAVTSCYVLKFSAARSRNHTAENLNNLETTQQNGRALLVPKNASSTEAFRRRWFTLISIYRLSGLIISSKSRKEDGL